ncbi:unnamed protein product [Adineta ricciae]|uniref:Uncharacterized protein n=1 Tax=Adineta ricciae TaxID=249248 RepID=A0A814UX09_ADIRI|nr:unnamed protein product [Adineta ricciae]
MSLASKSIDVKARKRIEELYELTDEIINAYNEIDEKYINQIYGKYKRLQDVNKKLKEQLKQHHCAGCKCSFRAESNAEVVDGDDESEESNDNDEYRPRKKYSSAAATTDSTITRTFIISDIEDTQNFDGNDSRFAKNVSNDEEGDISMDTAENQAKSTPTQNNEAEDASEEDMAVLWSWAAQIDENNDGENGMSGLPRALQEVIRRKAERNIKDKSYLLQIPRYPALCEFLRDKSRTSFDHRPTEAQVRPLIASCFSHHFASDAKARMRVRDDLREVHRSYMRTFMQDPRVVGAKSSAQKAKHLVVKKSPT